jgi:hypothetical protein
MKPNIPQTLQTVMLRNGQGMKNKLQPEPKTKPESKNKTRNKKTKPESTKRKMVAQLMGPNRPQKVWVMMPRELRELKK